MGAKFLKLYNSLPPEAQQILVEKHLVGLLDAVPKDKAKKVSVAATRLQARYGKAPKLDLRSKRKKIVDLLDDLARDAKTSLIKERSNREELLSEIVHSLVSWLNDVWIVVYEYNVQFFAAHNALLFVAESLAQLSESSTLGGCKCSVMNLPVDFTLKDKGGKVVKRFSILGPQNIDRILLWIWRDLFVSLFATGSERDKSKVPDLLEDIQLVLGVEALERLLYGGVPSEDEEEWEDVNDNGSLGDIDGEEDDEEDYVEDDTDYDSDESDGRCCCNLHASYWSPQFNRERLPLRECVERRLLAVFKETPSLRLFNTLSAIAQDTMKMDLQISKLLDDIAGDTPENLIAALDIYIANNNYEKIVVVLDKYMYLLRPRDMTTLQCAVALLDDSRYQSRSLSILHKELEDSLQAIYSTIRSCFSHIDDEANKQEIVDILKLPAGSSPRKARIEAWAESITSTTGNPMHPVAFAAMMMGLPMIPGVDEGDDADILNYVDLDQNDPDMDDIREEYRPNLKARFDGWVHLGQSLIGGPAVLAKLYAKAIEIMPYLRGQDIVNEMASRLRERPNKGHVLEALSNLSNFAKIQRKKLNLARGDKKRSAAGGAGSSSHRSSTTDNVSGTTSTSAAAAASPSPTPMPPPFLFGLGSASHVPFTPFPPVPGGMEDVD